jgi:hypothetical protein
MTTASSQNAGIMAATRSPHSSTKAAVSNPFTLSRLKRRVSGVISGPASVLSIGRRHKASSRIASVARPKL